MKEVEYNESLENIIPEIKSDTEILQRHAKKSLIRRVRNDFNDGNTFSATLNTFRAELNKMPAAEKDAEILQVIDKIDKFNDRVRSLPETKGTDTISDEIADDFFLGENGYRDLYRAIKRLDKNPNVTGNASEAIDRLEDNFNSMLNLSMNDYEKNSFTFNKYVAMNSGDFNMEEGADRIEGISKVTSALNWLDSPGNRKAKLDEPEFEDGFMAYEISNRASRMCKKNDIFKEQYQSEKDGKKKWDEKKIDDAIKNGTEWEVINQFRRAAEEKKKKKAEQEAIGKEKTEEKLEELAKEADRKSKEFMNNLLGDEEEEEPDLIEYEVEYAEEVFDAGVDPKVMSQRKTAAAKRIAAGKKKAAGQEDVERERIREQNLTASYERFTKTDFKPDETAIINGMALVETFNSISKDMKNFMAEFQNAQLDPTANSPGSKNVEGPKDYQNIMKQMQNITGAIENGNPPMTLNQLGNQMTKLFKAVEKYEASHKPKVRGHRTAESAERYNIMGRLGEKRQVYSRSINSLAKKTNDSVAFAKAGSLDIGNMTIQNMSGKLQNMYLKNPSDYMRNIKLISEHELFVQERKLYEEKILKGFKAKTDGLAIDKFYNSIDQRWANVTNENEAKIRNSTFASDYNVVEAAIVRRELRKVKNKDTTISELKAIERNIRNGGFKKEAHLVSDCAGYQLDREVGGIIGIKSKIGFSEVLVEGLEKNRKGLEKISKELHTKSVQELTAKPENGFPGGRLSGYKKINKNLIYNIGVANALSKPENIAALYDHMSINSEFNGPNGIHAVAGNKRIKKQVFSFIDKSGILDKMEKEGKTGMENLPELMQKMDDPKFQKDFEKMLKKVLEAERTRARANVRKTANARVKSQRERARRDKRLSAQTAKYERQQAKERERLRREEQKKRGTGMNKS